MSPLAPDLFDRRFGDFVEIGRARLRPLAPAWTDHNAHDPGITLMELLAWVAEAELYSVSRLRRDERSAYARLLGITSAGARGSRGLIWPDRLDPHSPAATYAKSVRIPEDAVIHVTGNDTPTFRPTHDLWWAPGRIQRLERRAPSGATTDFTRQNERGGAALLPFGDTAGSRDVLALTFECRDDSGFFGPDRTRARGALWTIGVIAAPPAAGGAAADAPQRNESCGSPLSAALVADDVRTAVRISSDTTDGMLKTGALLLDLDDVSTVPRVFTIELRAARGLARPPRVLRIEPNVIPVLQGRAIDRELHVATGLPDWGFPLDVPGLRFDAGKEPIRVEVAEPTGLSTWKRGRLVESGPEDPVYEFDETAGQIAFGNGINGKIPAAVSQVLVSYAVCDAEEGNVGRNRKWSVAGFDGTFGVNVDPIVGGAAPFGWLQQRREARRRSREEHALVSSDDIARAARALPLLEVARAWVVVPGADSPRTGVITLVAVRARQGDEEPERVPETRRWLDAIRRRLLPRIPLGTRLAVVAPRYVDFSIRASVEAQQGRDPAAVKEEISKALGRRLALVDRPDGTAPRQPGMAVTERDVKAWIRTVDGVKRIFSVELRRNGRAPGEIDVGRDGLPRWIPANSLIDVTRPAAGGAR
jgi:hypothetical protein